MQVSNQHNWPERSISYTSRSYHDQLSHGEEYREILPVINIGLLNFTLFPDAPTFYSRNLLMDTENHKIYSDKFDIRVLDLSCIHLATEEDKKYHIDYWARLFKSTTWEDIRMVAQNNTYLGEAAQTLYKMNADEMVRLQCLAQMDYEREQARQCHTQEENVMLKAALNAKDSVIAKKDAALAKKDAALAKKDAALAKKDAALAKKDAALADKDAEIASLKAQLQSRQ